MTFQDDTCDFCGGYCDPIGCDTKRFVETKFWCGQCEGGRLPFIKTWGPDAMEKKLQRLQAEYDSDPIDWNDYPKERTPEGFRAHLHRLDLMDAIHALKAELAAPKRKRP